MITWSTSGVNLYLLKFCSLLSLVPFRVDKRGYVRVQKNIFRVAVHRLWTLGGLGYMIFFIIRLYQATGRDATEWVHTLVTHVIFILTSIVGSTYNYKHCIKYPDLFAIVFNDISETLYAPGKKRSWTVKIRVWFDPFMWLYFPPSIFSIYAVAPHSIHTIYSALPENFKNETVLWTCATMEYFLLTFLLTHFWLGLFTMCSFFQMTYAELTNGTKELCSVDVSDIDGIKFHMRKCQLLQLRVHLFNTICSTSLYLIKLQAMVDIIFGIFFTIKLYETSPVFASNAAFTVIVDYSSYSLLTYKACDIPGAFQAYKHKIREMAGARRNIEEWDEVKRRVRGIQETGIAVGGFYYIEKTSTGDFIGFIIDQVVGLLVAYPKPIVIPE